LDLGEGGEHGGGAGIEVRGCAVRALGATLGAGGTWILGRGAFDLDSGREDGVRGIRRGSLDGMKEMGECQLRGKDQGEKARSLSSNLVTAEARI
jgi:hypothetical protein